MPHTILVVEDDPQVLHFVQHALTRARNEDRAPEEYEVLTAPTAEEGLRVGMEFPGVIHLLLADVMMPGMMGTEVATLLKEARPAMRVILMSGYPSGEMRVLNGGGWAFLRKPFEATALLDHVRVALRNSMGAGGA
jgi:DNA-binding response OmpR family regulator